MVLYYNCIALAVTKLRHLVEDFCLQQDSAMSKIAAWQYKCHIL